LPNGASAPAAVRRERFAAEPACHSQLQAARPEPVGEVHEADLLRPFAFGSFAVAQVGGGEIEANACGRDALARRLDTPRESLGRKPMLLLPSHSLQRKRALEKSGPDVIRSPMFATWSEVDKRQLHTPAMRPPK